MNWALQSMPQTLTHSLILLLKQTVNVSAKQFTSVDLGQLKRKKECKFRLAKAKYRSCTEKSLTSWVNNVRVWRLGCDCEICGWLELVEANLGWMIWQAIEKD